jgi:hypothetical protein
MWQQAPSIVEENVEEMDSPEAMEKDQFDKDATPSGEDEAQYEDDFTTQLHEPITQVE